MILNILGGYWGGDRGRNWLGLHHGMRWNMVICGEIGHYDVAKVLITEGANVNFQEETSLEYPIHVAAAGGFKKVVELLVANHAKLNECDEEGRTPLVRAIRNRRHDVIAYLRSVGALEENPDQASIFVGEEDNDEDDQE